MTKRSLLLGKNPRILTLRLPDWLYDWVKKKAEAEGIEMAKLVRKYLLEAMRKEEGENGV